MAISQAVCNTFKAELLQAIHDFDPGTDVFKLALYTSAANLGASTTAYTTGGEVVATSGTYTAGGNTLTVTATFPKLDGSVAMVTFGNTVWPSVTLTARGALLYNSSKSNRAIAVFDFGADKTSTNGDFTILFPAPSAATAVLRLT